MESQRRRLKVVGTTGGNDTDQVAVAEECIIAEGETEEDAADVETEDIETVLQASVDQPQTPSRGFA